MSRFVLAKETVSFFYASDYCLLLLPMATPFGNMPEFNRRKRIEFATSGKSFFGAKRLPNV